MLKNKLKEKFSSVAKFLRMQPKNFSFTQARCIYLHAQNSAENLIFRFFVTYILSGIYDSINDPNVNLSAESMTQLHAAIRLIHFVPSNTLQKCFFVMVQTSDEKWFCTSPSNNFNTFF